ncbi:MAG TPA: LptF/LptG family permease [Chitinophagaceae bacterium]|jgi:lipopolysaccharide export system permease protein|nr:MAG: putative permease YjgP/YjgQ family protein [Bacteroidetes bacterium ADurb.BinA245]HMW67524.1 LptF/LptG family permease [Chitinophagaceae bacterium]HNA92652.1 LptF/LptG family permease [Chitinophagaceae bacterium]HNF45230.1 LptF/LptG family permease [Chitinophagaceae bacterium]HNL59950.1 LptF/LptG family permease [Chitinophagaceae bacterium]
MKKIDWYILKKLLVTFVFCMLLFTVIAVAVDSSEKTEDFVKANMSTGQIITQYYLGFVPFIWSLLFPLFVFIAVIFFTSRLATRSEIIAVLAGGASYNRFLRPYLIGGILLAALLWVGSRYWIPKANIIRSNFQSNYIDKNDPTKNRISGNCDRCFYKRIDSNTYVGLRSYDTATKSAAVFFMEKVKGNKVIYNLRGNPIQWNKTTGKWKLSNALERIIDSSREVIRRYDSLIIDLKLQPEELRKDDYLKDKLTTPELVKFIKQEELRGTEGLSALKVERYRRTATPFAVLLLTIIGAVIASRKTRGGSGMHLAMGIIIAATFIISDRFSTVFATKGNFPPLLAAWIPNIFFSFIAFWLYRRTPK